MPHSRGGGSKKQEKVEQDVDEFLDRAFDDKYANMADDYPELRRDSMSLKSRASSARRLKNIVYLRLHAPPKTRSNVNTDKLHSGMALARNSELSVKTLKVH